MILINSFSYACLCVSLRKTAIYYFCSVISLLVWVDIFCSRQTFFSNVRTLIWIQCLTQGPRIALMVLKWALYQLSYGAHMSYSHIYKRIHCHIIQTKCKRNSILHKQSQRVLSDLRKKPVSYCLWCIYRSYIKWRGNAKDITAKPTPSKSHKFMTNHWSSFETEFWTLGRLLKSSPFIKFISHDHIE